MNASRVAKLIFVPLCLMAVFCLSGAAQSRPKVDASHAADKQKDFKFEVVSLRPVKPGMQRGRTNLRPSPDGYHTNLNIWQMIMAAYVPGEFEGWGSTHILNDPKWVGNDIYEINARVANEDLNAWQHQGRERELLRAALRNVLKERCKLVMHLQPKEVPDYKLVVAKKGPHLIENAPDPKLPPYDRLPDGGYMSVTEWHGGRMAEEYFHGATMGDLCEILSMPSHLDQLLVHDKTGLTGRYDFKLRSIPPDFRVGDILWDIHPLGLELKPGKYQSFSIVIDHVEKPDAN